MLYICYFVFNLKKCLERFLVGSKNYRQKIHHSIPLFNRRSWKMATFVLSTWIAPVNQGFSDFISLMGLLMFLGLSYRMIFKASHFSGAAFLLIVENLLLSYL